MDEIVGTATSAVPLSVLLSQILVAFTIEFDNEAERQIAAAGSPSGPPSLVMWSNYMRFVDDGVSAGGLHDLTGSSGTSIDSRLAALERWKYVTVEPETGSRQKLPRPDWIARPTALGRAAQNIWRPLLVEIEERWKERFGDSEIREFRQSLQAFASRFDDELPEYLPVLQNLYNGPSRREIKIRDQREVRAGSSLNISALLSQVLFAFTIGFEREARVSLVLSANALRVITEEGVSVNELPHLTGIFKEAIAMSLGPLEKNGYIVVEPSTATARTKLARLTAKGRQAQREYPKLALQIEQQWQALFGKEPMERLRSSLQTLIDRREGDHWVLARGLLPHTGCWRLHRPYLVQTEAMLKDPGRALPHYPMVTHRGGFPDGA